MRFDLSTIGDRALEARLNALPATVAKRLVRSSLRKGFKRTFAAVKQLVPVDQGALKRSLKLRSNGFLRGNISMSIFTGDMKALGYRKTRRPGIRGGHTTPRFPPAAIEFGFIRAGRHSRTEGYADIVDSLGRKRHVKRVYRATTGGVRVPARSFMRAALASTRDQVIKDVTADLWEGVTEYAASVPGGSAK